MEYRVQNCGNQVQVEAFGDPSFRISEWYGLTTDASLTGIEANFTRKQGTEDRVVAYASKSLSKIQRNYSATKRELFEIVHSTQHFKNWARRYECKMDKEK